MSRNNILFLADGKIEYNGKCVTPSNYSLDDCTNIEQSKFTLYDDKIMNVDSKKCVFFDGSNFDENNCDHVKNFDFQIQGQEGNLPYPRWGKKFGKNVVLVSSDNPWYINVDTTTPVVADNNKQDVPAEYTDYFVDYAYTPKKKGVEFFGNSDDDNKFINSIIIILLIIIAIQIVYLIKKNYRK